MTRLLNDRLRITAFTILLALCFCSPGLRLVRANRSDEIVLAEGTAINVVTAQEITSKDAKPNDPVSFTVAEDLHDQRAGDRAQRHSSSRQCHQRREGRLPR